MKRLEKFDKLVEALQNLPTIGKKSAMRLAYHMVTKDSFNAIKLSHAIEEAIRTLKQCRDCGFLSEDEICYICSDEQRDKTKLCIVESSKDILLFEENSLFDGRYFVLEQLDDITVERLKQNLQGVNEIIFALTPSLQNDGIILFIEDKLKDYDIKFSKIAQGVPTGVSLENIDVLSLSKAINDRIKV